MEGLITEIYKEFTVIRIQAHDLDQLLNLKK